MNVPLLVLALLAATAALPAADAIEVCVAKGSLGVCVESTGACASVSHAPFPDFGFGAGECPDVHVGEEGVSACAHVWALYMTIGGPRGVDPTACASHGEEGTCVVLAGDVLGFELGLLSPPCLP